MNKKQIDKTNVDAEGRPILTEVAVAGDKARKQGIFLDIDTDETDDADEESAPPPAATPHHNEVALEKFLQERIEQAVRRALPQATQRTIERLRQSADWYEDE